MGMNGVDIQNILRHANMEKAKAGLKKLTETVRKKYGIKA